MLGSASFSRTRLRAAVVPFALALLASVLLAGCVGSAGPRPPANFGPPRAESNALPAPDPADRAAIRAVMRRQERAWNAGDLEGFMAGYARTDTLRFASGGSVRTGWAETLARYRQSYPNRAAMGRLSFSEVDVELLSGRHALVFGRWRLEGLAGDGPPPSGLFTLLFEKVRVEEEGRRAWRIVHDHTSSARAE